ncbi:HAD family hydrolase [Schaalia naturae]|uniref:HAD family hydrolase n=1 Tax=Schaalia naturae TaxID=635203 RepID=A0ABW2SL77_9ACTO
MPQTTDDTTYEAVLFDLLTAVLDSWTLWNAVAGDEEAGLTWRRAYLELTYGQGEYAPYEDLVARAAVEAGLSGRLASDLVDRWAELRPWPEAPEVLGRIARDLPIGVVTNCSERLGRRAAGAVPVGFATVVTAERAGAYKPRPAAYRLALEELGVPADRVLSGCACGGTTGSGCRRLRARPRRSARRRRSCRSSASSAHRPVGRRDPRELSGPGRRGGSGRTARCSGDGRTWRPAPRAPGPRT